MTWRKIILDAGPPARRRRIVLDGREFILRIYWVGRLDSWFLDILNAEGVAVLTGTRMAVGVDLLAPYRSDARVPQGGLVVLNVERPGQEVGRTDLGGAGRLYWVFPIVGGPTTTRVTASGEIILVPGGGGGGPPSFGG